MHAGLNSVVVRDQTSALRFNTGILDFVKKADLSAGDFWWLTLVATDDPDGTRGNLIHADQKKQRGLHARLTGAGACWRRGGNMANNFFIAWAIVFVVWLAGGFAVHGVLLGADYAALPNLFRSEADTQGLFPLMLLAHVIMAGAFTWIDARGQESGPWVGQRVRFGIAVALSGIVVAFPYRNQKRA